MSLERIVRWRPLDGVGLEHCEIVATPEAIIARSVIIGDYEGASYGARYELRLDPDWSFRTLHLERTDGDELTLQSDGQGHWIDGHNRHLQALDGCIDIDLAGSPLTNTLPIRRNRFTAGAPQQFTMAWIPFDTLEPLADGQIYTLLEDGRYRYQAADDSFETVLDVDAEGFVTHYPGLFERV
jgi:hypothetical protein